jgi:O-antigen ligase
LSAAIDSPVRVAVNQPAFVYPAFRLRDWLTTTTLLSICAGLLTNFRFQFVGKASLGELALSVIAIFAVLANVGAARFWNRRVVLILATLGVTCAGYVISDLVNATPFDRLVRGWARIAFVILNFLGLWALTRRRLVNLLAFCLGDSLSSLLTYGTEHRDFLYNYKFHCAMPVTVFLVVLVPLVLRRRDNIIPGLTLIGVGMPHLWFDFRTLGGMCILIGFVLLARSMTVWRHRSLYLTLLMLAVGLSCAAVAYLYSTTNESYSDRRAGSNSQRLSFVLAGVNAIQRSPFVGLGSWVWDDGMWNVYAGRMGRASLADSAAGETMGPHSQIVQVWAEAGLLGLVFFVYFGKLLIEALWSCFFRQAMSLMTPFLLIYLVASLWDLLCSPFANLHRLNIALALVMTIHVWRSRERLLLE